MKNPQPHWIRNTIKELHLPSKQYAVFGSGLLDVLGLKKASDIDIIMTKQLFEDLSQQKDWSLNKHPNGGEVLSHETIEGIEAFYEASIPMCDQQGIERMISNATIIEDVEFVRLEDILAWKQAFGREKDLQDVHLINRYDPSLRMN